MVALRKGWDKQPPNKPGAVARVYMPDTEERGSATRAENTPEHVSPTVPAWGQGVPTSVPTTEVVIPVQVHVATLADRDHLHTQMVAALQAAAKEATALHRESMAMMVERVDAAEIRAERVEQRLDQILDQLLEQRRPWWARLLELWRQR